MESNQIESAIEEFKALSDAYCYDREWWNSEFDVNQEYRAYVDEIINKYDLSQEVILDLFKREIILADNE